MIIGIHIASRSELEADHSGIYGIIKHKYEYDVCRNTFNSNLNPVTSLCLHLPGTSYVLVFRRQVQRVGGHSAQPVRSVQATGDFSHSVRYGIATLLDSGISQFVSISEPHQPKETVSMACGLRVSPETALPSYEKGMVGIGVTTITTI